MSAAGVREGRRADGTHQRARGTNPRANGTNSHPAKTELRGQWRAAWRRLGNLPPDEAHTVRRRLELLLDAARSEIGRSPGLPCREAHQLADLMTSALARLDSAAHQ